MERVTRRIPIIGAVALVLLGLPALGLASAQMRAFSGRIDRVSAEKMIVDNRMGDKVSFVPADGVKVSGEGKTAWAQLEENDWVTVSWRSVETPRKAYVVEVEPPRYDD